MSKLFREEIKESLQKAFDLGVQEGIKREHALGLLSAIDNKIEFEKQKPLTNDQLCKLLDEWDSADELMIHLCRRIEAAHGIK